MLETLRNAGKTWVAKTLLVLLAASFGIWGVQDVFRGSHTGDLATVGDVSITPQEYSSSMRETLQNISRSTGQALTQQDAKALGYDKVVLDNLIHQAAVDEQVRGLKLAVSAEAVRSSTKANPAFQGSNGEFDVAAYANALRQQGISEAMYQATESRDMLRRALLFSAAGNFTMPQTMVEAISRYQNEVRDARYFMIRAASADVPAPTDAELKDQYDKSPAAYTAPEYRSVAVLKVEPADIAAKLAVTDAEIAAGFERLKQEFSIPEKRTILQIPFPNEDEARKAREKILGGMDFAALAAERGLAPGAYELKDVSQQEAAARLLDKQVAATAFALPAGQLSDVVKGSLVVALLKVVSVTPGHEPALDEVKDKVTDRLKLEKARDELQAIFDTVENDRNNQVKLETIAKQQGLPYQVVAVSAAGLDKDGKDVALPDKQELLKAAFASDVGDLTSPLNPTDSYIWYDVLEVMPSALKPFDTVKEQVKSDVTAAKVRQLLVERGQKIVAALKAGTTFDQAAQQEKAEVKQAQGLRRNEATPEFDIQSLAALFSVPDNSFVSALEGDGVSAKVMQALPVMSEPFNPSSPESKALASNMASGAAASLTTSYLQALRQQIPVTINDNVWKAVDGGAVQ